MCGVWRGEMACEEAMPTAGSGLPPRRTIQEKGCEGARGGVGQRGLRGNYVGSFESLQGLWLLF